MYKIRLTDSVTIQKFSILKPEVEVEFDDVTDKDVAIDNTHVFLEETVKYQLSQLVGRMAEKQKREALTDVSVDDRFKQLIKDSLK